MLRRIRGGLDPNNCSGGPCIDDPWTIFDDSAADTPSYSFERQSDDQHFLIIDSGIYSASGVRNQPDGTFTLSGLRYDLDSGQAYAQWRDDRHFETLVGCN